jgi:outer membrane receptor protein involved in Fe transport
MHAQLRTATRRAHHWKWPSACAAALALVCLAPGRARAADDAPVVMPHDSTKYQILVSATRRPTDPLNVPNAASVISGRDLRRRGAATLADAIQDVVGLDTGDGSDNGMRLPNIGMWGLKEFDALLVTVDGIPIGGPFNPSLSQIPIDDVERIEVVKGPQGTMYGVSAFAGMVQVFTNSSEDGRGHVMLGGGSFSNVHGNGGVGRTFANGLSARVNASALHSDGWQDRTGSELERGSVQLARDFGKSNHSLSLIGFNDDQKWGTALPYDPQAGTIEPGFRVDENYAVRGAHLQHRVLGAALHSSFPIESRHRVENTLSFTHDEQASLRSFPGEVSGDTVASEGVKLDPTESSFFDDLRLLSRFKAGGDHSLVVGTALTYGRTTASGIGFDFDQLLSDRSSIPNLSTIPVGDHRSFEDRRTFFGAYAHDEWTPVARFTLSGGGRVDNTSEKLHAVGQEVGDPNAAISDDSKSTGAWSGDVATMFRLAPEGASALEAFNVYVNYKSSFKPAAPNLTEAEDARILEPERTHSLEGGFKMRAFDRQLGLDFSWFQMDFENLVVGNLDTLGQPQLLNAGRERFKGQEISVTLEPVVLPGFSVSAGYAHHDARFVQFTFVDPDGIFLDVSGNRLELTPQDLFNVRASYHAPAGIGGWVASRTQGKRALDRDNVAFIDSFSEVDAGVEYEMGRATLTVVGRNLGDHREIVGESEIGDAQFYIAAPRRVNAELTIRL